jgi:hypothetical protein
MCNDCCLTHTLQTFQPKSVVKNMVEGKSHRSRTDDRSTSSQDDSSMEEHDSDCNVSKERTM